MNITYWSDYACPYCYIGVTHLLKALEGLGIADETSLTMLAFELDPDAPLVCETDTVERFGAKYGLTHEEALARVEGISKLGREAGIDFRYATTRSTSTFDAHRLTKLAYDRYPELAEILELHLYDAYFTENLELADKDVLREVALRAGLSEKDVEWVLDSDAYATEVRRDELAAARLGVHGVPYFVLDGKAVVPGCASEGQLRELVEGLIAEETTRSDEAEGVGACGPNGCSF